MRDLINQVVRLLTLASDGWTPGHSSPEADDRSRAAGPSHSRADVSNGIRWSDVVADIESEQVGRSR